MQLLYYQLAQSFVLKGMGLFVDQEVVQEEEIDLQQLYVCMMNSGNNLQATSNHLLKSDSLSSP